MSAARTPPRPAKRPGPAAGPPAAGHALGDRLALVVVAIAIFGSSVSSQFLTANNFFNLGLNTGEVAIMALPMALIIISGEIDLSVESTLGMSSALLGVLWADHWPMPAIFVVILVVGALAGAFNGLLVTRVGLPSLAVTIGTLALYRGIALILLGPRTVSNFPATYTNVGLTAIPHTDLPYSIGIFIVLAIIFGIVLHATPFGRSIYAMGDNAEAAMFAGLRVKRVKTSLFIMSGVASALAGVLFTFRLEHRGAEQRRSACHSTWSRSCCWPGCRSSAARARSSGCSSRCWPSPGCRTRCC